MGRIKNRNITSFTLTGSEDKLYTYKIRSYLKQGNKTLYSPSSKALEIKTAPGKPVITRIRVREERRNPDQNGKKSKLQKDIRYSGQNPRTEDIKESI